MRLVRVFRKTLFPYPCQNKVLETNYFCTQILRFRSSNSLTLQKPIMLEISPTLAELREIASQLPARIPYLKMLILFGSRARGDTQAQSDWDFAALYDGELREESCKDRGFAWFEVPVILGKAFNLNSDEIDVVDLNRCSPLIAHFVARDGILLCESEPGQFAAFKQQCLMADAELEVLRQNLRQKIEFALQRRGV